VVRDSAAAFRDIASIRWNWATGRYRTRMLTDLLEEELGEDVAGAAARLARAAHPADPAP
jgi:hypothetical protein